MNLFLATCALIKLYHKESGSTELLNFLKINSEELVILISDICKIEFLSSFMRKVRTHEIRLDLVREIFKEFTKDIVSFQIITVDTVIKDFVLNLIDLHGKEYSLRTLDSLHLSAALVFNQIFPVDYFVSSDKKLLGIAGNYFNIIDPEDYKE